jgi:hypothetical protein
MARSRDARGGADYSFPPARKLSDTKDPRSDGISREINKALILEHMKIYSPGKTLEEFSKPGHHDITLDYEEKSTSQKTEIFVQFLIDIDTISHSKSTWSVNTKGSPNCYGNMTLLLQLIQTLPNIVRFD